MRADVDGNVWAGTIFGGEGVDGVHVYAPDGTRIGQILMPEGCANLTLRRQAPQSAVHLRQPVGLHDLHGCPGSPRQLTPAFLTDPRCFGSAGRSQYGLVLIRRGYGLRPRAPPRGAG